jgi:hypothetical protein
MDTADQLVVELMLLMGDPSRSEDSTRGLICVGMRILVRCSNLSDGQVGYTTLGWYSPRDGQHPFFLVYPISVETGVLSIAGGGWGVGEVCNNGATHLVCTDPRAPLPLTLTDPRGLKRS